MPIVSSCSSRQFGKPSHTFSHGTHSPSSQRLPSQTGSGIGFIPSSMNKYYNLTFLNKKHTRKTVQYIQGGRQSPCQSGCLLNTPRRVCICIYLPIMFAIRLIKFSAEGNRIRAWRSQKFIVCWTVGAARNRPISDSQTTAIT